MELRLDNIPGLDIPRYAGRTVTVHSHLNGYAPFSTKAGMELEVQKARHTRANLATFGPNRVVVVGDDTKTLGNAYAHQMLDLRGRFVATAYDLEAKADALVSLDADPTKRIDLRRDIKCALREISDLYGAAGSDLVSRLNGVYARLDEVKQKYESLQSQTARGISELSAQANAVLASKDVDQLRAVEKNIVDYLGQERGRRIAYEFTDQFALLEQLRSKIRLRVDLRVEAVTTYDQVRDVVGQVDQLMKADVYDTLSAARIDESISGLRSMLQTSKLDDNFKSGLQRQLDRAYESLRINGDVSMLQDQLGALVNKYDPAVAASIETTLSSFKSRVEFAQFSESVRSKTMQQINDAGDFLASYRATMALPGVDGDANTLWDPSGDMLNSGLNSIKVGMQMGFNVLKGASDYLSGNAKRIAAAAALTGIVALGAIKTPQIASSMWNAYTKLSEPDAKVNTSTSISPDNAYEIPLGKILGVGAAVLALTGAGYVGLRRSKNGSGTATLEDTLEAAPQTPLPQVERKGWRAKLWGGIKKAVGVSYHGPEKKVDRSAFAEGNRRYREIIHEVEVGPHLSQSTIEELQSALAAERGLEEITSGFLKGRQKMSVGVLNDIISASSLRGTSSYEVPEYARRTNLAGLDDSQVISARASAIETDLTHMVDSIHRSSVRNTTDLRARLWQQLPNSQRVPQKYGDSEGDLASTYRDFVNIEARMRQAEQDTGRVPLHLTAAAVREVYDSKNVVSADAKVLEFVRGLDGDLDKGVAKALRRGRFTQNELSHASQTVRRELNSQIDQMAAFFYSGYEAQNHIPAEPLVKTGQQEFAFETV